MRNVADVVDAPRAKQAEQQIWSPDQLRAFLAHVREDRLYAVWLLIATTGLRRAEIAGLRWSDLDLEHGRLSVRRPRVEVEGAVYESEPKTAKGKRTIALDPVTAAALRSWRDRQAEERLVVGYRESGFVFTKLDGDPIHPGGSRTGSSSAPEPRSSRRSGCTTSATATPRPPCVPACRRRL